MTDPIDYLVLGAGRRGLQAGLRLRRDHRGASVRIVEADARPGGSIRTQRSNGFTCELGPFAFARDEIDPMLTLLRRAPTIIEGRCATGLLFDGSELREVGVEPAPVSFSSGCEELVQACRRELGDTLWLGREISEVRPDDNGWQIVLAGEVPTEISARILVCCLPLKTAARLLTGYDPALGEMATHLSSEARAFVFLGGLAVDCENLTGYGIVPTEAAATTMVEAIHCSNVFAHRCLPDRFLTRCELAGDSDDFTTADDAALTTLAIDELQRWSSWAGNFGFTKVHRFESVAHDATWTECRVRLQELASRIPDLRFD